MLSPTLLHVKLDGEISIEAKLQLSKLPPSTSEAAMLAFPLLSNEIIIGCPIATGRTLSCMVTIDEQLEELPFRSVIVKVTTLSPASLQVNELGKTLIEAIAQLSKLPPSTSDVAILTFPLLSNAIVIG